VKNTNKMQKKTQFFSGLDQFFEKLVATALDQSLSGP